MNRSRHGKGIAMQLDALDFVEGFRCEVALASVGATDDGDIFDDEEGLALAVATG